MKIDDLFNKTIAIIRSCKNELHIQTASKMVEMMCGDSGVGFSVEQTSAVNDELNTKIIEVQNSLTVYLRPQVIVQPNAPALESCGTNPVIQ